MSRTSFRAVLAVLILALPGFAVSCAKTAQESATTTASTEPALSISSVDLGRGVDADMKVTDETDDFAPKDVVHASVSTTGTSANSVLRAVWTTEDGTKVDESERSISPNGPANTEFHLSKPDGLAPGKYKLEIFLDGTSIKTEEFEVKAK